jgi:hypothetical protein
MKLWLEPNERKPITDPWSFDTAGASFGTLAPNARCNSRRWIYLTPDELDRFNKNQLFIWVSGKVAYSDSFGVRRSSDFLFYCGGRHIRRGDNIANMVTAESGNTGD